MYRSLSRSYRYDGIFPQAVGTPFSVLKSHYDQWRFYVSEFMQTDNPYLKGFTTESYQALVDEMLADKEKGKIYKEALESRNLIVRSLLDVAMLNNKYCIVKDQEGDTFAIELAKIRNILIRRGKTSVVSSCSSFDALAYLHGNEDSDESNNKFTLVKEVGHFIDSDRYSLNPYAEEWLDFAGVGSTRIFAFANLVVRSSPSIFNLRSGFSPNMMDEPDVRKLVEDMFMDRVVNGVRVSDRDFSVNDASTATLFNEEEITTYKSFPNFINYEEERTLITAFTSLLRNSLIVPGDSIETMRRIDPWRVSRTGNLDLVEDRDSVFTGSLYYWTRRTDGYVNDLFSKFRQIRLNKTLSNFTPQQFQGIQSAIKGIVSTILPKDGAELTLGQIVQLVGQVNRIEQENGNVLVNDVISGMFELERFLMNLVIEDLANQGVDLPQMYEQLASEDFTPEQKAEIQKNVDQFEATKMTPIYIGLLNNPEALERFGTIVIPSEKGLDVRFGIYMEKVLEGQKIESKNSIELSAQFNLISRILSVLSN